METKELALIRDFQTRFLFSFALHSLSSTEALKQLHELSQNGRRIWLASTPPSTYRQEMLEAFGSLMFNKDQNYLCYLRVSSDICNFWLRRGCQAVDTRGKNERVVASFRSIDIELFLLREGAGFISVRFRPNLAESPCAVEAVRTFNYRLSQSRTGTRPILRIPISEREAVLLNREAPSPDRHISSRLGALGGAFTLDEMVAFLLSPVSERCAISSQISIYTVVRLSDAANFGNEDTLGNWGSKLAGLAQIEETGHPGETQRSISIQNLILNTKHWAAVSSLGAAHLIADQSDAFGVPTPFNDQRMSVIMNKYFMAYALAHLQRLQVNSMRLQAQGLVDEFHLLEVSLVQKSRSEKQSAYRKLTGLRRSLSEFAAYSNLPEISNREAVNKFYNLSRQGLRLDQSLGNLRDALGDFGFEHDALNSRELAERFDHNIETVAAVQSKLEWLEVFIGSFYSAELINMIAEAGEFNHDFIAVSVPSGAVISAIVIALSLRPWEHGSEKRGKSRRIVLGVVAAALMSLAIWTAVGYKTRNREPKVNYKSQTNIQVPKPQIENCQ